MVAIVEAASDRSLRDKKIFILGELAKQEVRIASGDGGVLARMVRTARMAGRAHGRTGGYGPGQVREEQSKGFKALAGATP